MELLSVKSIGNIDALKGLIPIVDTFDVNPSDLANITDNNSTTASGVGTKVMGGGGTVGQLTYDLGSSKNVIIGGKIDLYASTGSMNLVIDVSDDNNTYINGPINAFSITQTSSSPKWIGYPYITRARYIRFRFTSGGAANPGSVKIHQLTATQL